MKSFLQGKRAVEIAALRKPSASAASNGAEGGATGSVTPPGAATPHIDIVKQGDKIVRIVVTCTCGERTEIECLYPPGQ